MAKNSCSIGHLRILLVEDDAMNRKVTMLMLDRLGYRADAASNGIDALRCIEIRQYDLVLMDIVMPEMDGFEAAREIRKRWRDWPKIVAVTAYLLPDLRERCIDAGMDGCLIKPVRFDDLRDVLRPFELATIVEN